MPSGVRKGVRWVQRSKIPGDRGGCKWQWWAGVARYSPSFIYEAVVVAWVMVARGDGRSLLCPRG